jgi:hypothetical protein
MSVTADTHLYTADNTTWPTADGFIPEGIISAAVIEAADAADLVNARVIAVSAGGFYPILRPAPVIGVGDGVLPRLIGEAHGEVVIAGAGEATLPLGGAAVGEHEAPFPDDAELVMLLMLAA